MNTSPIASDLLHKGLPKFVTDNIPQFAQKEMAFNLFQQWMQQNPHAIQEMIPKLAMYIGDVYGNQVYNNFHGVVSQAMNEQVANWLIKSGHLNSINAQFHNNYYQAAARYTQWSNANNQPVPNRMPQMGQPGGGQFVPHSQQLAQGGGAYQPNAGTYQPNQHANVHASQLRVDDLPPTTPSQRTVDDKLGSDMYAPLRVDPDPTNPNQDHDVQINDALSVDSIRSYTPKQTPLGSQTFELDQQEFSPMEYSVDDSETELITDWQDTGESDPSVCTISEYYTQHYATPIHRGHLLPVYPSSTHQLILTKRNDFYVPELKDGESLMHYENHKFVPYPVSQHVFDALENPVTETSLDDHYNEIKLDHNPDLPILTMEVAYSTDTDVALASMRKHDFPAVLISVNTETEPLEEDSDAIKLMESMGELKATKDVNLFTVAVAYCQDIRPKLSPDFANYMDSRIKSYLYDILEFDHMGMLSSLDIGPSEWGDVEVTPEDLTELWEIIKEELPEASKAFAKQSMASLPHIFSVAKLEPLDTDSLMEWADPHKLSESMEEVINDMEASYGFRTQTVMVSLPYKSTDIDLSVLSSTVILESSIYPDLSDLLDRTHDNRDMAYGGSVLLNFSDGETWTIRRSAETDPRYIILT